MLHGWFGAVDLQIRLAAKHYLKHSTLKTRQYSRGAVWIQQRVVGKAKWGGQKCMGGQCWDRRAMLSTSTTSGEVPGMHNGGAGMGHMVSVSPGIRYGGKQTVSIVPGDGIGNELMESVKQIIKFIQAPIELEEINIRGHSIKTEKDLWEVVSSFKRNKVGLKGVFLTDLDTSQRSINVVLRSELELFANVVICKTMEGLYRREGTSYPPDYPLLLQSDKVDCVIVRENMEGEYSGLEHEIYPGVVESLKVTSSSNSERLARYAFSYASLHGRRRVSAIHKANIMRRGDGLFLQKCYETSKLYPGIVYDPMVVDTASLRLVQKPSQFDVMVTPNLYGNIVQNLCAGLIGGAGMAPGMNIGVEYAIFEPGARHVAKDIEGMNAANPIAMLQSAKLMLEHINLHSYGEMIEKGIEHVIRKTNVRTRDIGGSASTSEFTEAVMRAIEQLSHTEEDDDSFY
eukprot:Nk52_evm8s2426 gene=Nk52_evmTU8s2426